MQRAKLEGSIEPATWKHIMFSGVVALGRVAVALERIATVAEQASFPRKSPRPQND